MSVKLRQELEKRIVMQVVRDAIAAGYALVINNDGEDDECSPTQEIGTIESLLFATDRERIALIKGGNRIGWIYFVYGNSGYDVISDYTDRPEIEAVLTNANKIADWYDDHPRVKEPVPNLAGTVAALERILALNGSSRGPASLVNEYKFIARAALGK